MREKALRQIVEAFARRGDIEIYESADERQYRYDAKKPMEKTSIYLVDSFFHQLLIFLREFHILAL